MTNRWGAILPLVLLVLLTACGQELTAGGQTEGEVSAVVTDDAAGAGASRSPDADGPRLSRSAGRAAAIPRGTVTVEGTVAIVHESRGVAPLSPLDGRAEVRIASGDVDTLALDSALVGRYTVARVTFTRVQAHVTSGLALGTGTSLDGTITVDLPQPLVVERPVELLVQADRRHELVIDLNAAEWLATASPLGVVSGTAFAEWVRVRVR